MHSPQVYKTLNPAKINITKIKMKCKKDIEAKNESKISDSHNLSNFKTQKTVTRFLTSPTSSNKQTECYPKASPSKSNKVTTKISTIKPVKPETGTAKLVIKSIVSKQTNNKLNDSSATSNKKIENKNQEVNIHKLTQRIIRSDKSYSYKPLIKAKYYTENSRQDVRKSGHIQPVAKGSRSSSVRDINNTVNRQKTIDSYNSRLSVTKDIKHTTQRNFKDKFTTSSKKDSNSINWSASGVNKEFYFTSRDGDLRSAHQTNNINPNNISNTSHVTVIHNERSNVPVKEEFIQNKYKTLINGFFK
jgi:hypothetical protein